MADPALAAEVNDFLKNGSWWRRQMLAAVRDRVPSPLRSKISSVEELIVTGEHRITFINGHYIDVPAHGWRCGLLSADTIARICLECP